MGAEMGESKQPRKPRRRLTWKDRLAEMDARIERAERVLSRLSEEREAMVLQARSEAQAILDGLPK